MAVDLLKYNTLYQFVDGITRYVIIKIKLGRGYTILWDSLPTSKDYWSDIEGMQNRQQTGARGYTGQQRFIKMYKPNAQQPMKASGV